MGYEREEIRRMHGYVPGKQPEHLDVIKLNTNENPYPPCSAVIEALRDLDPEVLRRYPPPMASHFRKVAAQLHGISPENIMAVNGGDELLRLAIITFVDPKGAVGIIDPSYSLYSVLADIHGCQKVFMDAEPDWSLPKSLADFMNQRGVQLTFVVNPHAPSGTLVSIEEIRQLALSLDGVLLLDEAYVNFIDPALKHNTVRLINELDNLVILRTLSKGYSLAGLRFGYALGAESLISPMMNKTRDTYNVDAISQHVAAAALQNIDSARQTWQSVRTERTKLRNQLLDLGFQVPESQSNFLLVQVDGTKIAAEILQQELEIRKVLVRYFNHPRLTDRLRITIGTPEQNSRLLQAIEQIL